MAENENVIAYIATLSGMERQVALDYLDTTYHPESWIVPLERRWEIHRLIDHARNIQYVASWQYTESMACERQYQETRHLKPAFQLHRYYHTR